VVSKLASGIQDLGFEPSRSEKIHSMPFFGGEVKPSVPCRRFAACKRTLRFTWMSESQAKLTGHFSPNPSFTNRGLSYRLTWSTTGDDARATVSVPLQTGPGTHQTYCTMDTVSFPGVETGRGVKLTPHTLLFLRSKNRVGLYFYSP
jgi:hypothetical protein